MLIVDTVVAGDIRMWTNWHDASAQFCLWCWYLLLWFQLSLMLVLIVWWTYRMQYWLSLLMVFSLWSISNCCQHHRWAVRRNFCHVHPLVGAVQVQWTIWTHSRWAYRLYGCAVCTVNWIVGLHKNNNMSISLFTGVTNELKKKNEKYRDEIKVSITEKQIQLP
jgi:hypothetical protein